MNKIKKYIMENKIFLLSILSVFCYILFLNRSISTNENYPKIDISTANMKQSVSSIINTEKPRNYYNPKILEGVADKISTQLQSYGYETTDQKFIVKDKEFKNVIASYGKVDAPRFIVGAHYDMASHFDNAGADDNASGVAGLLELARLFKTYKPTINYRIDFVAYTLEEPPVFRTTNMGSYVHAKSLKENNVDVLGMISLEMIGYYSDEENSQRFPSPIKEIGFLFPSKGNFISVVSNFPSNDLRLKMKKSLKQTTIPTETLIFPSSIEGFLDLSDHASYWKFGYPALLITDTAFFRNENYHTPYDTIDTLNFDKMKEVVNGTYWFLVNF
jgi:Zn-dependent M28 family amino/carboxypeptidase